MIAVEDRTRADTPRADAKTSAAMRLSCYHCGELCADSRFIKDDKTFCCNGCLTVHDILTKSGLGHFYDLNEKPGVRVRNVPRREQFAPLDQPELQQRLLDFSDGSCNRVTFHVPAIHCVACVWLLENLFRLHPGIGRSLVNFARREVAVAFAPQKIKLSELVALLASIGYEPSLTLGELEKRRTDTARRRQWLQIGIAGFAFGNIMLLSLPQYFGLDSFSGATIKPLFGWLSLALALPVLLFSASDYWKSALLSLRQRTLTLDVPIALGLAALYARSAFEIVGGFGGGYLDSLTGLVFFLLCGRIFQQKTHDHLAFDLDYRSFFPLSTTRKNEQFEENVSLSQLTVGDQLVIRNCELIPADSRLVRGPALVDYSFVTGESEPAAKQPGDYLYAGGRQVGAAIEVETLKPVSQSYLTSLWNQEAFRKDCDSDLNTLTNRFSRHFTLTVVAVALGAFTFWVLNDQVARGLRAFISVLIVACPCALALAAPFALGTAQRLLARTGSFVKNSRVLERMARVNAVVFDKTGTLTVSGSNAVSFQPVGSPLSDAEERWILALTCHSTHPYSVRVSESFVEKHFAEPVHSFLEVPGCGIKGRVDGHEVLMGSQKWLESHGLNASRASSMVRPSVNEDARSDSNPTVGSAVHLAVDSRYRGAFAFSSAVRPEIGELIRRLNGQYELALLSGDNERDRDLLLKHFGKDAKLHFNQSPLDKLTFIRRLQQAATTVMMVGDGLNDAGAFKQSDVGVAVVEKVGVFSPASDVIMTATQCSKLDRMLALARRSIRVVKWSFGISVLYNAVGVSFAAAGLLSPLICAILMPLSSVSVVLFACGVTTLAARDLEFKSTEVRP